MWSDFFVLLLPHPDDNRPNYHDLNRNDHRAFFPDSVLLFLRFLIKRPLLYSFLVLYFFIVVVVSICLPIRLSDCMCVFNLCFRLLALSGNFFSFIHFYNKRYFPLSLSLTFLVFLLLLKLKVNNNHIVK